MSAETEGRAAAQAFRRTHRLGTQPLVDLITVIEQTTGIDVAVLDAGPDEHGLAMRDPVRDAVFIGVARTPNPMRQRSTLAHELGHILFEDWHDRPANGLDVRGPEEIRADAFARHLLIPQEGLRDLLSDTSPATESTLSAVVQRFLVSPQIAAIALEQAGYIDQATKRTWLESTSAPKLAARHGWVDLYNAFGADSNTTRSPQRLLARAVTGYELGVLSTQAIATLRGITVPEAEEFLNSAGVRAPSVDITWADPACLPKTRVDLSALDRDLAEHGG